MFSYIYNRDNVQGLRECVPDGSIDLVITSPPYDNLRKYSGFTWDFPGLAAELLRVLRPGGVMVWVVADATIAGSETGTSFRQALHFTEIGFRLFDTMIWHKSNPTPVDPRIGRYTSSFEYMFVFSKGSPAVHNMQHTVCKTAGVIRKGSGNSSQRTVDGTVRTDRVAKRQNTVCHDEKILDNVWSIGVCTAKTKHPAAFPKKLVMDHVLTWSNLGDVILDPFMGSGTVAYVALQNGRNCVGFELSSEYVQECIKPTLAEFSSEHELVYDQ